MHHEIQEISPTEAKIYSVGKLVAHLKGGHTAPILSIIASKAGQGGSIADDYITGLKAGLRHCASVADQLGYLPTPHGIGSAELIARERKRQIYEKGFGGNHDDEHNDLSLVDAAICYLRPGRSCRWGVAGGDLWPWEARQDKRGAKGGRRLLVIAAALIAAEIDRQLRIALADSHDERDRYLAVMSGGAIVP